MSDISEQWYLPQKPQVKNSGFERDEFLDYAEDFFLEALDETFLGEPAIIFRHGTLDESTAIHTNINVWGNTPVRENFHSIRHLVSRRGQAQLGNYVKYQDKIYLITEPVGFNSIHDHTWMHLTTSTIKFINHNGKIVEYPIWFGDETRFHSGETENKHLVLGAVHLMMALPKNEDTIRFKRGLRFIIDDEDRAQHDTPMVYTITKVNAAMKQTAEGSLFVYNLAETQFFPGVDCATRMIANFYDSINDYVLNVISPSNIEVSKNGTYQIQFIATINGDNHLNGIEFKSSNESVATISPEGLITAHEEGDIEITISFFGATPVQINVKVVDVIQQYQSTAKIDGIPELRLGGTARTFTARFFNQLGEPISDIAVWSVFADGVSGVPSWVNIVETTSTTIRLQAVGGIQNIGRIFFLRLTGSSGMSSDTIAIEIVSLT
jgi:hypothetical protein